MSNAVLTMKILTEPPLREVVAERVLRQTKQSVVQKKFDLVEWSQRDEAKKAWLKPAEREGLEKEAFEGATWVFLDSVLGRSFDIVTSVSKARKAGWTGFQNYWNAPSEWMNELVDEKVLLEMS